MKAVEPNASSAMVKNAPQSKKAPVSNGTVSPTAPAANSIADMAK